MASSTAGRLFRTTLTALALGTFAPVAIAATVSGLQPVATAPTDANSAPGLAVEYLRVKVRHVDEVAKAQLLLQNATESAELRRPETRVEEELRRVVTGLAVDIDGRREVGTPTFVEPVVIREPRPLLRDADELATALVVDTQLLLLLTI